MKTIFFSLLLIHITYGCFSQQHNRALPDFGVVQYAGSIGYFSAGLGYDIFKSNARFSLHYGIVPPNVGGRLNIVSAKLIFKPVTFDLGKRLKLNPFDIGIMGSYTYGDDFKEEWPEGVHPEGYYWWNPAIRSHLAMESAMTYLFAKKNKLKAITGYVEFNTNDLYIVSFAKNTSSVSFWKIVKLGAGVRVHF